MHEYSWKSQIYIRIQRQDLVLTKYMYEQCCKTMQWDEAKRIPCDAPEMKMLTTWFMWKICYTSRICFRHLTTPWKTIYTLNLSTCYPTCYSQCHNWVTSSSKSPFLTWTAKHIYHFFKFQMHFLSCHPYNYNATEVQTFANTILIYILT